MMWVYIAVGLFVVGLVAYYLVGYAKSLDSLHRDNRKEKVSIPVDKEHFIPVPKRRLEHALESYLDDDEQRTFEQFSDLLELTVKMEYRGLTKRLLQDFEAFDPNSRNVELTTPAEVENMLRRERRLLSNFHLMMTRSNFKLVTLEESNFSDAARYQLHVPTVTEWDKLDEKLISGFHESEEGKNYVQPSPPPFANHMLIWHRGVGVDKMTARMVKEKIDTWLTSLFHRMACRVYRSAVWKALGAVGFPQVAESEKKAGKEEDGKDMAHVKRIALRKKGITLSYLFEETTIQEPTFKEVVALFRLRPETEEAKEARIVNERAITIKTFSSIPLGDLEIVMPCKKILYTITDGLRLLIIAATGLLFTLHEISDVLFSDGDFGATGWTTLMILVGYASKIYFDIQYSMDTYKSVVMNSLYNKSTDNHSGVILYLLDALESQEFKECAIAYVLLLHLQRQMKKADKTGAAVTEEQLDKLAEEFLAAQVKKIGLDSNDASVIDFEVDDAVNKLIALDLAKVVDNSDKKNRILKPVSLSKALGVVQAQLQEYNMEQHDHHNRATSKSSASSVSSTPTRKSRLLADQDVDGKEAKRRSAALLEQNEKDSEGQTEKSASEKKKKKKAKTPRSASSKHHHSKHSNIKSDS